MRRAFTSPPGHFLIFLTLSFFSASVLAHIESARLTGCDPCAADQFGISVAIDGSAAVVGAYNGDSNVVDSGIACVFELSGSQWLQTQKLFASDASSGDKFGRSVAIQGDTIVVGSYNDDAKGSVYVFKRLSSVWSQQQKLVAPDAASNGKFGVSVSIDNNTIAVGAYGRQSYAGAVYIFTQIDSNWSFQQQLTISDANVNNYFGYSVDIDANTIIAGAPNTNLPQLDDIGSVYIFTRSGTTWSQQAVLAASDFNLADHFGWSVALDGNFAVIGAYECDINGILDAGAAYVFSKTESVWIQQQKLTDTNSPGQGFDFGKSVAIENDTIFAACPGQEINDIPTGAVFEFVRNGSAWLPVSMLTAQESQANDNFGSSLAASGCRLVIGAQFNNSNGQSSGSAYVFDESCDILADFDGDSDVDFADFALLASSWLQNDPSKDIAPPQGDNIVNIGDLALFCDNWLAGK